MAEVSKCAVVVAVISRGAQVTDEAKERLRKQIE
jgi:hypothetical protein